MQFREVDEINKDNFQIKSNSTGHLEKNWHVWMDSFKNSRLVVPHTLRSEMLRKILESHMGIVKCKERSHDVLYWLGMANG